MVARRVEYYGQMQGQGFFYLFKSTVYYTVLNRSPWQHYVKGSYTPPAHVVSVPPKPQL